MRTTRLAVAIASRARWGGLGVAGAQPVKPAIKGPVSMGAFKFVGSRGDPVNTLEPLEAKPIFGEIVIVASWAQLQPGSASDFEPGVIDKALEDVRAYNTRHPEKPLSARLRIWGGFKAPGWAMKIGGPPIQAVHNKKNRRVGRFWSPEYRQACAGVQQKLVVARYDSHPLIREVSMTSCMSFYRGAVLLAEREVSAGADPRGRLQRSVVQGMPQERARRIRAVGIVAYRAVGQIRSAPD